MHAENVYKNKRGEEAQSRKLIRQPWNAEQIEFLETKKSMDELNK